MKAFLSYVLHIIVGLVIGVLVSGAIIGILHLFFGLEL